MTSGQKREIQAGIPGSELAIFEDSSHYPFAEERQRFLATLDDFLSRAERRTGPQAVPMATESAVAGLLTSPCYGVGP
jgi:hypothetical protein